MVSGMDGQWMVIFFSETEESVEKLVIIRTLFIASDTI